eukprot:CAMPEP_0115501130 /NCGR_PEP_ID=MMETSP0271-20121206/68233_1 /TAXON_ID=71861 /ORGANISM="Scrippsiella trochoidea, Strain CCMP3099" /LENGTH=203 /DNA_ID=CAMNT_0002930043 /DNA_START=401 /DNA_END=1009 /DNA_ORIENTATION=+
MRFAVSRFAEATGKPRCSQRKPSPLDCPQSHQFPSGVHLVSLSLELRLQPGHGIASGLHLLPQSFISGKPPPPQLVPLHVPVQLRHVGSLELIAAHLGPLADDELQRQTLAINEIMARLRSEPQSEWRVGYHTDGEVGHRADALRPRPPPLRLCAAQATSMPLRRDKGRSCGLARDLRCRTTGLRHATLVGCYLSSLCACDKN